MGSGGGGTSSCGSQCDGFKVSEEEYVSSIDSTGDDGPSTSSPSAEYEGLTESTSLFTSVATRELRVAAGALLYLEGG